MTGQWNLNQSKSRNTEPTNQPKKERKKHNILGDAELKGEARWEPRQGRPMITWRWKVEAASTGSHWPIYNIYVTCNRRPVCDGSAIEIYCIEKNIFVANSIVNGIVNMSKFRNLSVSSVVPNIVARLYSFSRRRNYTTWHVYLSKRDRYTYWRRNIFWNIVKNVETRLYIV